MLVRLGVVLWGGEKQEARGWAGKQREHLLSLILCGMKLRALMASWSLLSP